MIYSFEIWLATKKKAKVCVDTDLGMIGFVGNNDDKLNRLLTVIVNAPYLIANTGDFRNSSYIGMEEKITIQDERFVEVLKTQLFPYEIKNCSKIQDKTIEEVLNEGIS